MTTQQLRNCSFCRFASALASVALMEGCSAPTAVDSALAPAHQYIVKDVRYFLTTTDRIDTTTVQLKGFNLPNPTPTLVTQQVEANFDELTKTSRFSLDPVVSLPSQLDLAQLEVKVPQYWNGGDSFAYFAQLFPLSSAQQERPYNSYEKQTLDIKIPPKSTIAVSRQIDRYQLMCSFQATLEDQTTGQRYPLTGKWQGLLRYNNASTTLKQSPL